MHSIQRQISSTKPDQLGPDRPREQMAPPGPEGRNMNLEQLQEALLAQQQQSIIAEAQFREALNQRAQHEAGNRDAYGLGRPIRGIINHFTRDSRAERFNSALHKAVSESSGIPRLEQKIERIRAMQQEQAANAERFETEGLYQQYGTSRPEAALRARGLDVPTKPAQAKPAYKDFVGDGGATYTHMMKPDGTKGQRVGMSKAAPDEDEGFDFDDAAKLRTEFNKQTQGFADLTDSYGRIQASAQNPDAAGDLALIFNYMKMLDPGSTVRKGEFATAQNSASIPNRIWASYNRVLSGERMAEGQRQEFVGLCDVSPYGTN